MNDILIALISGISVVLPAFFIYKRDIKKLRYEYDEKIEGHIQEKKEHKIKADVLDKLLDFSSFNTIKRNVDEIFKKTKADRFLILIAINGKTNFKIVSVVFEQHKKSDYEINAIARYRNLEIDDDYKEMLKLSEREGAVHLKTDSMRECLLKQIYLDEEVTFSDIRHIARIHIDDDNDLLVYSSLATHSVKPFTERERTRAKIIYDSGIRETLIEVLKKN